MKPLMENVKVGKKKSSLLNSYECLICTAKDKDGKDARMKIDKYTINHSEKETLKWLLDEHNVAISAIKLRKHLNIHSPYIIEAKNKVMDVAANSALATIDKLEDKIRDADDVIQDIINKGGEAIEVGDLPITERLLIAALKEQGARRKFGSLHQLFTELDKQRFQEGEIVEDPNEIKIINEEEK